MNSDSIYERTIQSGVEDSLSRISALIDANTVILDIGCSSGMLGRYLVKERGCIIDGIDIEQAAVESCESIYRKTAVKNLETEQLTDVFREASYDYIVVADVVEHLVHAENLLKQLKLLIKPPGTIFFSIPNIGHISVPLHLLISNFSYHPTGLLDSTHLRFFTHNSFISKLESNGIYCWETQRVLRGIDDTEFGEDLTNHFSRTWLEQYIANRPDALTYQWIFAAKIFPRLGERSVEETLSEQHGLIPLLTPCLYWDEGMGFSEARKLTGFALNASGAEKTFLFPLDEICGKQLQQLRIDIFSSPQWFKLLTTEILDKNEFPIWYWEPGKNDGCLVNAAWLKISDAERVILADHEDAHWIPSIPPQILSSIALGCKLSVKIVTQSEMRIGELTNHVLEKNKELLRHLNDLTILRKQLSSAEASLSASEAKRIFIENALTNIVHSNSWRITRPVRGLSRAIRWLSNMGPRLLRRGSRTLKAIRVDVPLEAVKQILRPQHERIKYAQWIAENEFHACPSGENAIVVGPLISIIMPTYNTPPGMLSKAIMSVLEQDYLNWELCIADDASSDPATKETLRHYASIDSRIHTIFREKNGHIIDATNSALKLASGEFIGFLDHDDELAKGALTVLVKEINDLPDVDILYSDEDKISENGVRSAPFFKPDWSPHLAISQAYLGHFVCYRSTIVSILGGLRQGYDGAQDYDFWLRASKIARVIKHVPKVPYHWRMHAASTAQNGEAKPYAHEAGRRAVHDFLRTRYPSSNIQAKDGEHLFTYQAKFDLSKDLLISIIIPTKDKADLLEQCIHSILTKSTWNNVEILVVDNNSSEPATFDFFSRIQNHESRVRVLALPIKFNWSRLNNLAAQQAKGDVFVFLNNDTKIISEDWLENLAGYALLPDVATVGGLLLFEDGTVQHSGVVIGMHEWAEHVFRGLKPVHSIGPFVSPTLTRNVLAVTGACQAISREKFVALGGFDEEFEICGSDVELGLRAHKRGLFNVMCAEVRLYHFESKTRTPHVPENDFIQSDIKYFPFRKNATDPFFNPNLSLNSTTPQLGRIIC